MSPRRDLMHFYVVFFFFAKSRPLGAQTSGDHWAELVLRRCGLKLPRGGRLCCFGTLSSKALTLNGPSVTVNGDLHVSPSQTTEQIIFIFFNRAEKKMVISANQRVNRLFIYLFVFYQLAVKGPWRVLQITFSVCFRAGLLSSVLISACAVMALK